MPVGERIVSLDRVATRARLDRAEPVALFALRAAFGAVPNAGKRPVQVLASGAKRSHPVIPSGAKRSHPVIPSGAKRSRGISSFGRARNGATARCLDLARHDRERGSGPAHAVGQPGAAEGAPDADRGPGGAPAAAVRAADRAVRAASGVEGRGSVVRGLDGKAPKGRDRPSAQGGSPGETECDILGVPAGDGTTSRRRPLCRPLRGLSLVCDGSHGLAPVASIRAPYGGWRLAAASGRFATPAAVGTHVLSLSLPGRGVCVRNHVHG